MHQIPPSGANSGALMWCRNHFAVLMFTLCLNTGDGVGHDNRDGDEDGDIDDTDHVYKVVEYTL